MEHLLHPDLYVEAPRFLVILEKDGREVAVFGGHIITEEDACYGILFRATQLLQCSMVNPLLSTCTAKFVCEFGSVQFTYRPEDFSYQVAEPGDALT